MSASKASFEHSIQDAENLLRYFNKLNTQPPPPELEVLKRAGLIMAMTAWETYVEDRLQEAVAQRLVGVSDSDVARFINKRLKEEIKRLHSPVSKKTIELFQDYANVDLTAAWCWNNHDPKTVKTKLNALIQLRGDVVHRSRKVTSGPPEPHPVTKAGLEKAISFLKSLVDATEKAFDPSP